jgi:hypothetical protein
MVSLPNTIGRAQVTPSGCNKKRRRKSWFRECSFQSKRME